MSEHDNVAAVRRFCEALTDRDWVALRSIVADDCEWTEVPSGHTIRGVHELVEVCRAFTTAFPDFVVRCDRLIAQGDLVACEWSARGTHDGPLERPDGSSEAPTGRSFVRAGVAIVELRDGRIVRYRDHFDRQTLTEQLGFDV